MSIKKRKVLSKKERDELWWWLNGPRIKAANQVNTDRTTTSFEEYYETFCKIHAISQREVLMEIRKKIDEVLDSSFLSLNTDQVVKNSYGQDMRGENGPRQFLMTPLQQAIWNVLDKKALNKQELANKVCKGDGSRLYKKGGLKELREHEWVGHKRSVGFYRFDAPPPEICPQPATK